MKKIVLILFPLIAAAMLAGCGSSSKISKANYEKIKEGMTRAEVVAILGEPTGTEVAGQFNDQELKVPIWEGRGIKIVALFSDDGKLTVKRLDTD